MKGIEIDVIFICLAVIYIFIAYNLLVCKAILHRNEQQADEPHGSTLIEGMTRKEGSRGLVKNSRPALSWYRRLFR